AWGRRSTRPLRPPNRESNAREDPTMAIEPTPQVGNRLMFENDRVRVWDLDLAPGESFAEHIHQLDYFYIVASGGLLRFDEPDAPGGHRDVQFVNDQVAFRE